MCACVCVRVRECVIKLRARYLLALINLSSSWSVSARKLQPNAEQKVVLRGDGRVKSSLQKERPRCTAVVARAACDGECRVAVIEERAADPNLHGVAARLVS